MAANMVEKQVESTTITGTGAGGWAPRLRIGIVSMVVTILIATVIGSVVLHVRQASHPAAPTIRSVQVSNVAPLPIYTQLSDGRWIVTQVRDDGTVQTDFIGLPSPESATWTQQRFLENNTTNLPDAVTAKDRPVVSSVQQKFIGVNTAWLPASAGEMAPSAMTTSQRRFLEVNTTMMPAETAPQITESRPIYRISDSYYFVPVAGGMWEVVHAGTDGPPVIEDYVSGPPPADAIAVTP